MFCTVRRRPNPSTRTKRRSKGLGLIFDLFLGRRKTKNDENHLLIFRREASPVQNEKKNERIRVFPHEEGNWAISVFIPVRCSSHLDTLIDELFETMRGDWKKLDDLHISLSKTFPIRYLHIESIRTSLKEEFSSSSFRFTTQIENVKILDNDDRSTSFFVLTLNQTRQFRRLVRIVDEVFEKLRYPTYYEVRCFLFFSSIERIRLESVFSSEFCLFDI